MPSSSETVTQSQLSSLDDTDCYASIWEQILEKQKKQQQQQQAYDADETTPASSSTINSNNLWGGRGKGGRGLARRTIQPRDVVLEDVRLQYLLDSEPLIDGATIKLLNRHCYSLIGRNGCGKSTLLRRMHSQKIPGWSVQWSSLYIPPDMPLECMELSPLQVVRKYWDACQQTSRSAAESRMGDLEEQMEQLDVVEEQAEIERLCEEISRLEDTMIDDDDDDDYYLEHQLRISDMLKQNLHIMEDLGQVACKDLTPGQQKEVLLLVASVCSPRINLLLLDEPTTNLDIYGLLRLRQLIEGASATVVMVSHDVDLINDVATDIIDIHAKKLWYYPGNYDSYRLMKEQKESHHLKQALALEKKRDQLKSSLQHLKEAPIPKRKGGSKKKAKAIASQRKKIEWNKDSMVKLDSSASFEPHKKGLTASQRAKLAEVKKHTPDKSVQFVLPQISSKWGEPLITAFDVGYGIDKDAMALSQSAPLEFDGKNILKRDGFLFDCVDICIEEGSRNCILGPTSLTSCLLNILAKRLVPVEGTVHHASGISVGFCDSKNVGELVSSAGDSKALDFLCQLYPQKAEKEIRAHLTAFGLSSNSQTKTPVCCLSGGEAFRFAFAKIMLDDPPILCLDSPTSSLDVESVQALAHGLLQWNGTLVMTSHDANFLRSLENVKCAVLLPEEGKLRKIVDTDTGLHGMDAYLKSLHT